MKNRWLYALSLLTLLSCASSKSQQQTGQLCGTIAWQSGNRMPSPDQPTATPVGIAREIQIYELTNQRQVQIVKGFMQQISTKRVAVAQSDAAGHFCVKLPVGKYSVFVNEPEKGLWSNLFDGEGNIFPVEIKAEATTNIQFLVNYKASY